MKGDKVYLRPLERNDLNILNTWKNDKEIYQYLGGGFHPVSMDQHEKWLDSLIDMTGSNQRYMIRSCQEEKSVGMVGLYGINWIHRTAEIGLFIGSKEARNKGFATESYKLLESYALNFLNLRKLTLKVVDENQAAVSLWRKLGFSKVGCLHDERYINGAYKDVLIMEKFIQ